VCWLVGNRLWSSKNNDLLHDFENIHSQQATCAEFSADGSMVPSGLSCCGSVGVATHLWAMLWQLVTNSRDNTLNVIDTRIFQVVKCLQSDAKSMSLGSPLSIHSFTSRTAVCACACACVQMRTKTA
jgi:hypothetical protein